MKNFGESRFKEKRDKRVSVPPACISYKTDLPSPTLAGRPKSIPNIQRENDVLACCKKDVMSFNLVCTVKILTKMTLHFPFFAENNNLIIIDIVNN